MLEDGSINPGQMTNFNHFAFGAVGRFLHEVVGGLRILEPGWKHFEIASKPGGTVTSCRVTHKSPYGLIVCVWKIVEGRLQVEIKVPPDSTARVILPGVNEVVGSGKRAYETGWVGDKRWPPKCIRLPYTREPVDEFVA